MMLLHELIHRLANCATENDIGERSARRDLLNQLVCRATQSCDELHFRPMAVTIPICSNQMVQLISKNGMAFRSFLSYHRFHGLSDQGLVSACCGFDQR